jgi:hypothetical protein
MHDYPISTQTAGRRLMHIGTMGRFSTVVMLLLAACGDNIDGDDGVLTQLPDDRAAPGDSATDVPRYWPGVCGVQSWTAGTPKMPLAMNVSVLVRPDGAAVLATPREGGTLTGLLFDTHMEMLGASKLGIDGVYSQVVASDVKGRLLASAVEGNAVQTYILDDKLENSQFVEKVPGTQLAEPAFYRAKDELVMPVAGDDGLWMHHFSDSFELLDSKHVVETAPARSMAAAQMGSSLFTTWSTDSACYMMLSHSIGPGVDTRLPFPCENARIAVSPTTGDGLVVFDSVDGVHMMRVSPSQFGGEPTFVRGKSTSPRTLFDGTTFWLSYLDPRGDIVVGFVDPSHGVVTMSLGGPKPAAGAYEFVMIDGSPWVFSVGDEGYSAYRMCVDTQW